MQILTMRMLRLFGISHADAARELREWYKDVEAQEWTTPADVKAFDPSADYVGGDRWVFNIRHNRYRLVVRIFFPAKQVYVRFIGTHRDYDAIPDITTI